MVLFISSTLDLNFEFLLFGYLADLFTLCLQVLGEICEQGYSDAFKFLKENGMLLLWVIIGDKLLTCVVFFKGWRGVQGVL